MLPNLASTSHIFDEDNGHFISAEHQRIAEILAEFDPSLRLMYVPANELAPGQKPFALGQIRENLPEPYVITYLDADEIDHRLVAKVFAMREMAMGGPGSLEKKLLAAEQLVELKREQQRLEDAEIAKDKAKFLWNTPKHTVTMDGKVLHL